MLTSLLVVLSCGAAFALAACGESKEEQAKNDVCDARADISKQVDAIKSVTIGASAKEDVSSALDAIKGDLQKMRDAQGDLSDDRKQQVQTAAQDFGDEVERIVTDAVDNFSLADAPAQIQGAVASLTAAFEQALAPIDC